MKTILFKRLYTLLFICWIAIPAMGQQYPDSLMKYLEIAAKNNPSVNQRFYEYKAALQKVPQVGSLPDPELSAGVFLQPMEILSGNQIADLRLMQMFPWFGVLRSAKDEMSLMANAKFELFRDAKLQVYYDVQRKWYELYKIRKDLDISKKNFEILKTIERLALVKFQANPSSPTRQSQAMQEGSMEAPSGTSGLADLYRIQLESGELQNNIASLYDQDKTTTAQFNSLLNRPSGAPVITPDSLGLDSPGFSFSSFSDTVLRNNPMLAMLEYEKLSVEARKKVIKGMGYPMVGFGLNYSVTARSNMSASTMNGKDMIMPMVAVTLPVYRKKYKAMEEEADLLKTASEYSYELQSNTLQSEFYKAIQSYNESRRKVKLYRDQYQLASWSLELSLKSYSTSSSDLAGVLRVRQQVLDYELKQAEAVADFNTAVALLKRLMAYLPAQ